MSALSWIKQAGLVTLTPVDRLDSIVGYVVGNDAPKKWWSHPMGNDIYNLFSRLTRHSSILTTKLIDGKVTLIHRRLWPILVCVAQDNSRRRAKIKSLPPSARKLLGVVERIGAIRLDMLSAEWPGGTKQIKKDRLVLEKKGLVASHEEHTKTGTHHAVLESWVELRRRRHIEVPKSLSVEIAELKLKEFAKGHKLTIL